MPAKWAGDLKSGQFRKQMQKLGFTRVSVESGEWTHADLGILKPGHTGKNGEGIHKRETLERAKKLVETLQTGRK